jgi:long-chain fatty acid transport protein
VRRLAVDVDRVHTFDATRPAGMFAAAGEASRIVPKRMIAAHTLTARLAIACASISLAAIPAAAQSSLSVPIQFDFLNPSARSLALGGAFVGLADDATAALVNPAGLVALTRKEVSAEGRYRRYSQPFLAGGRLSGSPTGQGLDTVAGPDFDDITDSRFGLNFVSFVYPRGRWRIGVFRHELIRVDQEFESRGPFQNRGFDNRDTALSATRTLGIDSYGTSVGLDAGPVWIGGGVQLQHFSLGFNFDRFSFDTLYGPPNPELRLFEFRQSGDDVGVGAMLGVTVPLSVAQLGVSYKRSPRFDLTSSSGGAVGSGQQTASTFKVPDVLALGASAPIGSRFLLTGEYTYVFHSQLRDSYVDVLINQGESQTRSDRFSIDDAGEVHFGAEYLLPIARRPAIRGGVWFDPDHSVHYAPTAANDFLDERVAAILSSGRDLWHYTFGTMVALSPRLDLSGAADLSARSTVLSVSAVWRF